MTRAEDILGQGSGNPNMDEPVTTPADLPAVGPKAGWRTSEGQLTFVFMAVAMIFSWFKVDVNQGQIQTGYEMIMQVIESIGPIVAAATALWAYIVSRGKQKSNAINATAAMAVSRQGDTARMGMVGLKGPWSQILNIGKAIAPALPGPVGSIAGEILGDQTDAGVHQYNELITVAKNHEGRIKALEAK